MNTNDIFKAFTLAVAEFDGEFSLSFPSSADQWGYYKIRVYVFNETLELVFFVSSAKAVEERGSCEYYGDTNYRVDKSGSWYSFSRVGIESSFYSPPVEIITMARLADEVGKTIAKEKARAAARVERLRADPPQQIPGTNYSRTSAAIETLKVTLKRGQPVRLAPSGFGIGHEFSTRKLRSWSTRAKAETEKFFGVGRLWVTTFDHD